MEAKREQALVGLFVIVAAALLVTTVFLLSGAVGQGDVPFHTYFKNAGGLQPGNEVRYSGGPVIGRVTKVVPDPQDTTRMRIDFSVRPKTPVRTDSVASITSTSPLGENFLGISSEKAKGPLAPPDSTLKSKEYMSFSDISDMLGGLGPDAQELLTNLNTRVTELQETLTRVNDVLDAQNRANIAASLSNIRGMLEEDRPAIRSTLANVNSSSAKLGPLIDDFKKTSAQANDAINHIDEILGENRADLRDSIHTLRNVLASADSLTDQLNRTLDTNSENLDLILDNLRHITQNMKEFTDTIKRRPYTLIRSSSPKPHHPGEAPPKD
jgi:phospholipid/cholesterol/gamma-HCH transport system substrate-binding protein